MASKTPKPLTGNQIAKKVSQLSGWQLNKKETELTKTFATHSFVKGLSFVAKIAVHAEVLGHHPDIELSYAKVKVKLTTHDVKGLTTKDFELAKKIEALT